MMRVQGRCSAFKGVCGIFYKKSLKFRYFFKKNLKNHLTNKNTYSIMHGVVREMRILLVNGFVGFGRKWALRGVRKGIVGGGRRCMRRVVGRNGAWEAASKFAYG